MFDRVFSRQNKALLRELVITDFKLRYQGSFLGYLWSLLRPLGLFFILYIVFVRFLRLGRDIEHFPVYLLLGIVLWNYFIEATNNGMNAIVARGDLLRKIKFPRYIIVVSGTISATINLLLNLSVVFIFMLVNGVDFTSKVLLFPLVLAQLFIFTLGIAFFLATAYVRFRDISHIWEVLTQGAFYATPILYPLGMIPEKYHTILLLNPMAQIVQDARSVLVTSQTITIWESTSIYLVAITPIVSTLLISWFSASYFRKSSKYFAEDI